MSFDDEDIRSDQIKKPTHTIFTLLVPRTETNVLHSNFQKAKKPHETLSRAAQPAALASGNLVPGGRDERPAGDDRRDVVDVRERADLAKLEKLA